MLLNRLAQALEEKQNFRESGGAAAARPGYPAEGPAWAVPRHGHYPDLNLGSLLRKPAARRGSGASGT